MDDEPKDFYPVDDSDCPFDLKDFYTNGNIPFLNLGNIASTSSIGPSAINVATEEIVRSVEPSLPEADSSPSLVNESLEARLPVSQNSSWNGSATQQTDRHVLSELQNIDSHAKQNCGNKKLLYERSTQPPALNCEDNAAHGDSTRLSIAAAPGGSSKSEEVTSETPNTNARFLQDVVVSIPLVPKAPPNSPSYGLPSHFHDCPQQSREGPNFQYGRQYLSSNHRKAENLHLNHV